MPPLADQSIEAVLADLQAAVRALQSANLANRASVTNAEGGYVALSQLAFGQVTATDNGLVELWGPANATPGGVGWNAGAPYVDVLVTGGRLRVDAATALNASGNKCSAFLSWAVLGPGATPGSSLVEVVPPSYSRAVEIQYNGTGMDQRAAMGTFGLHEGLAPGWYRVAARYAISYSGSTAAPYGTFTNRRIAATPY